MVYCRLPQDQVRGIVETHNTSKPLQGLLRNEGTLWSNTAAQGPEDGDPAEVGNASLPRFQLCEIRDQVVDEPTVTHLEDLRFGGLCISHYTYTIIEG